MREREEEKNTERLVQNRLCMDKGDFARDVAETSVCSQRKAKFCYKEEGAKEAQRNALFLTLKAPFDFTRLKVCTALPKMM